MVNSQSKWGEVIYDHYARYLGQPIMHRSVEAEEKGMALQILQFGKIFGGCDPYATLGFSVYQNSPRQFVELICVVDGCAEYMPELFARVAMCLMDAGTVPYLGMSLDWIGTISPEFAAATGKECALIWEPMGLHETFEQVKVGRVRGRVLSLIFISRAEWKFLQEQGIAAMTDKFNEAEADIFSVKRESVI